MGLDMYEKSLQIKTNTNTDSDKIRIDFYKSEGTRTIGQLQIRVAQGAYKIVIMILFYFPYKDVEHRNQQAIQMLKSGASS